MWLAITFFALLLQCSVTTSVDAGKCDSRPIYYASECLDMEECAWCCESPVGNQCFPKQGSDSIYSKCNSSAVLVDRNMTCGDLCFTKLGDCKGCEMKNWCYFCISSLMCHAPYERCPGNSVIQSCAMRDRNSTGNMYYFEVIIGVGTLLCGAALIASLVLLGLRVHQRMREERPSITEASVSLINHDAHAHSHVTDHSNHNDGINNSGNAGSSAAADSTATRGVVDATVNTSIIAAAPGTVSVSRSRENIEAQLTPVSTKAGTGEDEGVCFLCLDASPSVTFLPCYHTCCCEDCSNKLRPTRGDVLTCPFCRTKIVSMVSLQNMLVWSSSKS